MQRDEILRAAATIFREKGFHGASMQEIADAVHLQKASLYHHIQSKQELLLVLLDQALDQLIADLRNVVDADLPAAHKLRLAVQVYIGHLTADTDLSAVLLLEHRNLEPELRGRHLARRDRFEGLWRQIIQEGVECGAFRPVDVPIVAFALLGVQNWTITWFKSDDRLTPAELAEAFADFFLRGLQRTGNDSG
jgi:AcrR family transcriptional regulator